MMNKGLDTLTIKDYSTNLESLSTDKLKKLLHVSVDEIMSQRQLLDREVRDKLNQYLRCMEIEDSRYEASFGEINTDSIYYYYKGC